MRQRTMCVLAILLGAFTTAVATAQQPYSRVELGLTVNLEHSWVAQPGTPGFWLKGAAADGSLRVYKGLALAAEFSGGHVRIGPGATLDKLTFQAGPRYSGAVAKSRARIFVEALFGTVHGFDGLFPASNATVSSANGLAMQLGGGINYSLGRHVGIRPAELDYVHTNLPNNAANSQNDFRFATGLAYHFGK